MARDGGQQECVMATRVRTRSSDLYEQDYYAWAREQATLLRAGRFEDLDLENLTEEVEDLGGSLYRSVRSRIRTIIEHLLKLEHSPAAEPRGLWRDTIHAQRADFADDLTASLRRRLESELPKQYVRARRGRAFTPPARRDRGSGGAARDLRLHPRPDRRRLAALTSGARQPARCSRNQSRAAALAASKSAT
jgi:Domain of unknown function DUF29